MKPLSLALGLFLVSAGIVSAGTIGWETDCSNLDGWSDNADDPAFGTRIDQFEKSVVRVTQEGPETWGKVSILVKDVDLDRTPFLILKLNQVDVGSGFKVLVDTPGWSDAHPVLPTSNAHGTHVANLKEKTGWSGTRTFRLLLIVEGKGKSIYVDHIKIASEPPQGRE